jgi:hypothetical protein
MIDQRCRLRCSLGTLRYYVGCFGRRAAVVMLPILLARLTAVNRGRQT